MTTLDIANYKTENWSVSRSIADALWTLTAQLDKHATPAFFTKIRVVAEDPTKPGLLPSNTLYPSSTLYPSGVGDLTPFVGIFPGSEYIMAPVGDKAMLTGYDYTWYLTTQYVPITDTAIFPAGDGKTAIGTDPAETVRALLGGDADWATVTGVKPYRMTADADWGTRQKVFEFDEKCTRWQAIQEIAEYCNYVFVVKPYYDSGDWYSYAYFIPEANIDDASAGLDLPATQTFTKPDAYLLPGTTIKDNPEKGFNRVKVTGYDESTQTYYYHTSETAGVTAGTELAIEYFYASKDLNTQTKVDTRADELLAYFQDSSKVYTARLKQRFDLELYQKVRFADYDKIEGTTATPMDMRITRITYHHAAVDDYVEIEFAKDQDAQQLKRLTTAVNPDSIMGIQSIIRDDMHITNVLDQFDAPAALPYDGSVAMTADLDMAGHGITGASVIKPLHIAGVAFKNYNTDVSLLDIAWNGLAFVAGANASMDGNDLSLVGGITMYDATSPIVMTGSKITGLQAGTNSGDAIEHGQLDSYMLKSVYDSGGDGVIDISAGGTGISTFAEGDILYASAVNTLAALGKGTTAQVLTMNAAGALPEWADANSGVTDHGALTGLGDDDHSQYLLVNGTRAMTGALNFATGSYVGKVELDSSGNLIFSRGLNTPTTALTLASEENIMYASLNMSGNSITNAGRRDGKLDTLQQWYYNSTGGGVVKKMELNALAMNMYCALNMNAQLIDDVDIVKAYGTGGVKFKRSDTDDILVQVAYSGYAFVANANADMNTHNIINVGEIQGKTDQDIYVKPLGTGILYLG